MSRQIKKQRSDSNRETIMHSHLPASLDRDDLDDLRIERALCGVSPEKSIELERHGDAPDSFNSVDKGIAMVDVWIVASELKDKSIELTRKQKEQVFRQFVGFQEREDSAGFDEPRSRLNKWLKFWVSSAAAALLITLAVASFRSPTDRAIDRANAVNQVQWTIDLMRQAMIDNPPKDMLRWVWTNQVSSEPEINGDIIWSDHWQVGYALIHGEPKDRRLSYELRAFSGLDSSSDGVFCGQFQMDPLTHSMVLVLEPKFRVENPQRFFVKRIRESSGQSGGNPTAYQDSIAAIAQAETEESVAPVSDGIDGTIGVEPLAEEIISPPMH